jgi:hypothetical protein
MARARETAIEIQEISEREAKAQVRETYANPEGALKFFDTYVSRKQQALKALSGELEKDPDLMADFAQRPIGFLNERRLLGPLDQLHLEGLTNPFLPFPWPIPRCRLVCRIECRPEIHWVCVSFFGFRICWPVFHVHCRWVCRIVCF